MSHETEMWMKTKVTPRQLMPKALLAPLLAIVAMCATACTSEIGGQPTGSNTPTQSNRPTIPGGGSTTVTRPTGTKGPDPNASPVRNTDPCTLLSPTQTSGLGVAQGKRDDSSTGTSRSCEFVADRFNLRVTAFDVVGTKDLQATGEVKPAPSIGKHQAVQSMFGAGTCVITIAITETSRVDTTVSGDNATTACQIAIQAAQMIEPKLPGGG